LGRVKERDEAQRDYDEAVKAGKSAVIANESKEASDIMELELGAFGANEEAEVTIKEVFEMKLAKKARQFQYKFPTSLFVRYGDTVTVEASQNSPMEYVLNFTISSYAGVTRIVPKPWLGAPTDGDTFTFEGNRKVFEEDHDVVLGMVLAQAYKGVKLTENWKDLTVIDPDDRKTDKMLLLSSFLINVPSTPISELPAKEYVIVVDCSGSMNGDRMNSAKETLQLLINSLPVGSFFNIVRFGGSYESLFDQPKEYNKESKEVAMELASTMRADLGGTELFECLKSILKSNRHIEKYKRQVFVLTDGGITNQDETLQLVRDHAKENRLFSFGIGSGCSTALVNGLADAGMGSASFVTDASAGAFQWEKQENLSSICVKSLMASASQHISAIKISPQPRVPTKPISILVDSTCLNVFHDGFPDKVSLEVTMANKEEEHSTYTQTMDDIETIESPFESNVLHKLSAKKMISEMANGDLSYFNKDREEMIKLSVREQVLSPFTALVGVADETTVIGVSQRVDTSHTSQSFLCSVMMGNMYGGQERFRTISNMQSRLIGGMNKGIDNRNVSTGSSNLHYFCKKKSLMRTIMDGASNAFSKTKSMFTDAITTAYLPSVENENVVNNKPDESSKQNEKQEKETLCASSPSSSTSSSSTSANEVTVYQNITNLQNPGGEWTIKLKSKHDDNLLQVIESRFEEDTVKDTLYAIMLLLVDFSDTLDEWKLTAVKGVAFLKLSVDNLKDEIITLLKISKLHVDGDILSELLD